MKAILTALLCMALYPATTMASKARLEALGQSTGGSHYLMDTRNMFLNPASIMDASNQVMVEWGAAGTTKDVDGPTTPKAEGGFIKDMGSMKMGFYLGAESPTGITLRNSASAFTTGNAEFMNTDNVFEVFFAGDAGMGNWGASLTYSANAFDDATNKADENTMGVRLGMMAKSWNAYTLLGLGNKATGTVTKTNGVPDGISTATDEYEGKLGYEIGGGAHVMGGEVFFKYKSTEADIKVASATAATISGTEYALGWAKKHESGAGFWFYSVEVESSTTKAEASGTTVQETSDMTLPMTIGFEANAKSWLALRGSVKQNFFINEEKNELTDAKNSHFNTTTVAGGASLKFDAVNIDATLGTVTGGTLNANDIFSRVGVNYTF